MILDLIIMAFTSLVLHFYKVDSYWHIFESVISTIIAVILIILSYNKRLKNATNTLYEKILNVKYFDISLILFSFFVLIASITIVFNLHNLSTSVLLIILSFFAILVFGILVKYRINVVEMEIFLKTLKENNEFYIKMEDENRIFRHNLNAKLLSIKSVSNAKAKSLLDELLKENNHHVKYSGSVKAIPYGFNGIVYEKLYPYLNILDIKIENQIDHDIFMMLTPRRYNVLVEKLVIALDNAIEACVNSKEKALIINMHSDDNNIVVEIRNTFSSDVNLENLGDFGYSTKGRKRGLGLFSVLRNNEASLSVKIVNDLFVTKISAKRNFSK
ncbi:MAG: ATP-binding protein [Ruminococcus sp.]|nr:ATP-binding protein [Ruminococcus sp.]